MVLVQKWPFVQLFFLGKIGKGKCLLRHSRTKKCLSRIKKKSSKSRRIAIFLKGLIRGFWTKMTFLATSFFLGKIGQENVFGDILEWKNAFLGYKTRSSKSQRIAISPKGLAHGFGTKMAIFLFFFFFKIGHENVFYDILERKKCLL